MFLFGSGFSQAWNDPQRPVSQGGAFTERLQGVTASEIDHQSHGSVYQVEKAVLLEALGTNGAE